ncbi:HAD family hydrolase [Micromonospora inaquosa]|uniref:Haloacid dehalogenase n=1 Tax=Micromonospora inaquosa TaxID=2203716 RepID=A0A3N9WVZ8_9ACTN|nr:HAD family hydrolase [Micromonospora inaquosa]RQX05025.1 haloacid dehalogenase [Micromonospora inaquosa]
MPSYQAVLFDFFGTLTHSVQRGAAHAGTAELLGCHTDALSEVLNRTYYERASGRFGNAEATLRWVCAQVGVHPTDQAVRAAVASRHLAVRADTWLRADAVPVLAALRERGLRTGVISDCTHELPAFLPQLAVAPLLDVQVFSVQVGRCKPDLTLYLTACQRLGLTPGDCLYVGDGGSQELTGAERAGMTAVRLAAPDLATHMVFNADRDWRGPTLDTLGEVLALVDADAAVAGVAGRAG